MHLHSKSVIASEELESHPETVWGKVSENMKVPLPLKKSELMELIGDFGSIRVNVQLENRSTVHQMERKSVSTTVYRPGANNVLFYTGVLFSCSYYCVQLRHLQCIP